MGDIVPFKRKPDPKNPRGFSRFIPPLRFEEPDREYTNQWAASEEISQTVLFNKHDTTVKRPKLVLVKPKEDDT